MFGDAAKRVKEKPGAKKAGARRKNAAKQSGQVQPGRLWVDTEFLRSLTRRAPRTIVHPPSPQEQNYYLKLAEIILGPTEKRKTDRIATAFQKSPAPSKKRKD